VHSCNSQSVCLLSLLEPVSVDSEVKVATAILVSLYNLKLSAALHC
jgi:hypothetical protein